MCASDARQTGDVATLGGVRVRRLGRCAYAATLDAMRRFTDTRDAATADEIWLVEHDPVYTLGQAGRIEHLLREVEIPVIRTERGGQITYHGPGQVVAYPLVDLKRRGIKVREFVAAIEDAVIAVLRTYNLDGRRKPGAPGVYVERDGDLAKIAALGLKIARGCSFHGVSVNVAMDLAPYRDIDACGYPGLATVDLATLGRHASVAEVGSALAQALVAALDAAAPAA